jgi:hypothetical protein
LLKDIKFKKALKKFSAFFVMFFVSLRVLM